MPVRPLDAAVGAAAACRLVTSRGQVGFARNSERDEDEEMKDKNPAARSHHPRGGHSAIRRCMSKPHERHDTDRERSR